MMNSPLANFRRSGSLLAGLLVGSSMVAGAFALAVDNPGAGTAYLSLGALLTLASGIAVQVSSAAPIRRRRPRSV